MANPSTTHHLVSGHALAHFNPVDKSKSDDKSDSGTNIGTIANYKDIAAIDARLTAISATVYSAARLAQMTLNDKLYALSKNDDTELHA